MKLRQTRFCRSCLYLLFTPHEIYPAAVIKPDYRKRTQLDSEVKQPFASRLESLFNADADTDTYGAGLFYDFSKTGDCISRRKKVVDDKTAVTGGKILFRYPNDIFVLMSVAGNCCVIDIIAEIQRLRFLCKNHRRHLSVIGFEILRGDTGNSYSRCFNRQNLNRSPRPHFEAAAFAVLVI